MEHKKMPELWFWTGEGVYLKYRISPMRVRYERFEGGKDDPNWRDEPPEGDEYLVIRPYAPAHVFKPRPRSQAELD